MDAVKQLPFPDILKYRDYRIYLRDVYNFRKHLRPGFSYRQFSQLAGLKSPNYLQLVILGERNLTERTAERIAQALKLRPKEIDYFIALVRLDNAATPEERREAERWQLVAAKRLAAKEIKNVQSEVLSEWYHLLVRELVLFKDFEPSGEYIAKKLNNTISVEEAQQSLALLLRAGFLIEKDGRYQQADPVLDSGLDLFMHSFMQQFHSGLLKVWSKNLENLGAGQQELGVLNIPIAKDKIPLLREKIRIFQDEIIGLVKDEDNPDCIVQLGTYLLPFL